jgi:hypothetical protein
MGQADRRTETGKDKGQENEKIREDDGTRVRRNERGIVRKSHLTRLMFVWNN